MSEGICSGEGICPVHGNVRVPTKRRTCSVAMTAIVHASHSADSADTPITSPPLSLLDFKAVRALL